MRCLEIKHRNILVFDIETVGLPLEHFPEEIQTYLTKFSDSEEKKIETVENFALNPLTAKIAAICMLEHKSGKGYALINCSENVTLNQTYAEFQYIKADEETLIRKFWSIIKELNINMFVTFNGREFDCPFIMLRSFYHRIKPSFNLMRGSDFTFRDYHIDLMREMIFNSYSGRGARKKFSLDFYCRSFGIKSPKSSGISGDKVGSLFYEKKFQEIADYCIGDVIAENELFKFWNEYFNI